MAARGTLTISSTARRSLTKPTGRFNLESIMTIGAREKLIAATRNLMITNGYGSTGVDQICKKAGVSKGSFYHCFETKEDVAIAALNEFYREGLAHLSSLPLPPVTPDQRFLAFLDILAEDGSRFWQDGCLLGGLASEMAATSPTVQKRVGALFAEMAAALEPMARAFVDSLSDRPMTASEMAEHFLVVVEGAIVLSRSHNDPHRINDAIRRYAQLLRSLQRPDHTKPAQPKGK